MPLEALILTGVVALVILVAVVPVIVHHRRRDRFIRQKLERAKLLGTSETLSLHPVVDEGKCIGCEECVRGCPEQDVLALYRHKAVVIDAVECVGHGICERVCPVGAITLVVGTESRGLEIPKLTENFETNVPGLYVVGELGGMGLIRNAIWQAAQAIEHIRGRPRVPLKGGVEVLVVGAGPAGLAAALAARESRLSCRIIDQDTLGGSMLHYPRRKLVMTHPASLPGIGEFPFREIEKESLLAFWRSTAERAEIEVEEGVVLQRIERADGTLVAQTSAGPIRAARVVLALGRRGSPRKLEVPGEISAKVLYRLIEAHSFDGQRALVSGGGSAALETALALAERPRTTVTLCHRRDSFSARTALIEKLFGAERHGRLEVLRNTRVTAIEPERVTLDVAGAPAERPNDVVFVMIGGVPPYQILRDSGVDLETKFGTPIVAPR